LQEEVIEKKGSRGEQVSILEMTCSESLVIYKSERVGNNFGKVFTTRGCVP
jgi:hypothetical protein